MQRLVQRAQPAGLDDHARPGHGLCGGIVAAADPELLDPAERHRSSHVARAYRCACVVLVGHAVVAENGLGSLLAGVTNALSPLDRALSDPVKLSALLRELDPELTFDPAGPDRGARERSAARARRHDRGGGDRRLRCDRRPRRQRRRAARRGGRADLGDRPPGGRDRRPAGHADGARPRRARAPAARTHDASTGRPRSPARWPQRLLADHLQHRLPALYQLLAALGAIDENDPARAISLDALADALGDPAATLRGLAGWGSPALDGDWITNTVADLAGSAGLPARIVAPPAEAVELVGGVEPETRCVELPVASGLVAGALVEAGVLVLPAGDGLALTNLTWGTLGADRRAARAVDGDGHGRAGGDRCGRSAPAPVGRDRAERRRARRARGHAGRRARAAVAALRHADVLAARAGAARDRDDADVRRRPRGGPARGAHRRPAGGDRGRPVHTADPGRRAGRGPVRSRGALVVRDRVHDRRSDRAGVPDPGRAHARLRDAARGRAVDRRREPGQPGARGGPQPVRRARPVRADRGGPRRSSSRWSTRRTATARSAPTTPRSRSCRPRGSGCPSRARSAAAAA